MPSVPKSLQLVNSRKEISPQLFAIARLLDLDIIDYDKALQQPRTHSYWLVEFAHGMELQRQNTQGQIESLRNDFTDKTFLRRLQTSGLKHPLAKSLGLKNRRQSCTVIDATAGLGQESLLMASWGCQVCLLEQSAIVFALLTSGLEKGKQHPVIGPLLAGVNTHLVESTAFLLTCQEEKRPDVVYCDPMFPSRRKTAKVKKKMQFLQEILPASSEENARQLLAAARQAARQRTVVKRPKGADFFAACPPDFSIHSPSLRFDVYTQRI